MKNIDEILDAFRDNEVEGIDFPAIADVIDQHIVGRFRKCVPGDILIVNERYAGMIYEVTDDGTCYTLPYDMVKGEFHEGKIDLEEGRFPSVVERAIYCKALSNIGSVQMRDEKEGDTK